MTAPTRDQLSQLYAENARAAKAQTIVNAIMYFRDHAPGLGTFGPGMLADLSDEGWDALAVTIGLRPDQVASAETRTAAVELYRETLEQRRRLAETMSAGQVFTFNDETGAE